MLSDSKTDYKIYNQELKARRMCFKEMNENVFCYSEKKGQPRMILRNGDNNRK
jgi:hypothetical protein